MDTIKAQKQLFQVIKHKTMDDVVKVVDKICYVMPDSDEDYIIAVSPKHKLATHTTFYEADDFYEHSDYNYNIVEGRLCNLHEDEAEEEDRRERQELQDNPERDRQEAFQDKLDMYRNEY